MCTICLFIFFDVVRHLINDHRPRRQNDKLYPTDCHNILLFIVGTFYINIAFYYLADTKNTKNY